MPFFVFVETRAGCTIGIKCIRRAWFAKLEQCIETKKAAIEAFFNGESLYEISEKYQINTVEIESLLRVASVRLATAVKKMDSAI